MLHAMKGRILDKLRHGELVSDEWKTRLQAWRKEVLEKVGSMQFDSVEEIARQCGCDLGEVERLRRPDKTSTQQSEECRTWFREFVAERTSVDVYLQDANLSDYEAGELRLQVAASEVGKEAEGCDRIGDCGDQNRASCAICAGSAVAGHCPGCRPVVAQEGMADVLVSWHESLPWRGLVNELPADRWKQLLLESKALTLEDRRVYGMLASLEYFCRQETRVQRLGLSGPSASEKRLQLLIGSLVETLAALRRQAQGVPSAPSVRCLCG